MIQSEENMIDVLYHGASCILLYDISPYGHAIFTLQILNTTALKIMLFVNRGQ